MKTNIQFHRGLMMPLAAGSAALVLAFASVDRASAQTNTGTGPNAKVVTSNGTNAALSITTGTDNSGYGNLALKSTTTGIRNTALGSLALRDNVSGQQNTAVGYGTLTVSIADNNTALGYVALDKTTSGTANTASGALALFNNTTGAFNPAHGFQALRANIGGASNVAVGYQALLNNTSGDFNVALGDGALLNNTSGSGNIAIGEDAGFKLTTGNDNILIGNRGIVGQGHKIRIGTDGTHTDTYLAGIIHGNGSALTGVIVPATNVTGTITGTQIAAAAVTSVKLGTNLTFGGTTNGTFSGHLTGNATNVTGIVAITNGGTGSAVKNFVDLTSNQTSIGGTKAFTGNVGIGTTSPLTSLHIKGNAEGVRIEGSATGAANGAYVSFNESDGTAIGYVGDGASGDNSVYLTSYSSDIHLYTASGAVLTATAGGAVGIGTTNPTKAKVEINGFAGSTHVLGEFGFPYPDGVGSIALPEHDETDVSLWASGKIWAERFLAFSDERIKHIEGRSDAARDLSTLLSIEVTDYSFIDTVVKGTGKQKKVIAQQVEKVFPQAVSRSTDVVPDIYQKAEVKEGWVKLATSLKVGERVRLIGEKKEGIHEVIEVTKDGFRTGFTADGDAVFVYGREVKDFRSVDYDAIAMLNVSATQEVARKVSAQDAELARLRAEVAMLNAEKAAVTEKLAVLEARDQAREARLTRLENSPDNRPARAVNAALALK